MSKKILHLYKVNFIMNLVKLLDWTLRSNSDWKIITLWPLEQKYYQISMKIINTMTEVFSIFFYQ